MAKKRKRAKLIIIAALFIGVAGAFAYIKRHDITRDLERASLPKAVEYKTPTPTPTGLPLPSSLPAITPAETPTPTNPAPEANLAIPFTPQAPHANWEDPYGEFCEEASALMTMKYVQHQTIPSAEMADQEMLNIKAFEEKRFGYYKDTTAAEVVTIFREYFKYDKVKLLENPTTVEIKQAIANGQAIIVPAAGRQLGNPYFQTPGPLYHMLVIKGYNTKGQFIVNDPGTRRGADFLYDENVLMNAIHDWRSDQQIDLGRKVVIIVG